MTEDVFFRIGKTIVFITKWEEVNKDSMKFQEIMIMREKIGRMLRIDINLIANIKMSLF